MPRSRREPREVRAPLPVIHTPFVIPANAGIHSRNARPSGGARMDPDLRQDDEREGLMGTFPYRVSKPEMPLAMLLPLILSGSWLKSIAKAGV